MSYLENENYRNQDKIKTLVTQMDSTNLVILYNIFTKIGNEKIIDELLIERLQIMKCSLDSEDKMLGYYKKGHFAIAVLLTLGLNPNNVFDNSIDDFDRKMVIKLCEEHGWLIGEQAKNLR
jgi:hypothetical protein